MELNLLRIIGTVVALSTFVAIVVWAYSRRARARFDAAAALPFADDERASASVSPDPHAPSPRTDYLTHSRKGKS